MDSAIKEVEIALNSHPGLNVQSKQSNQFNEWFQNRSTALHLREAVWIVVGNGTKFPDSWDDDINYAKSIAWNRHHKKSKIISRRAFGILKIEDTYSWPAFVSGYRRARRPGRIKM
jgi:hypothetical protein